MGAATYYKVRVKGKELYYTGKKSEDIQDFISEWKSFGKGKLYTRHAAAQLMRYWKKHYSDVFDKIEVVEFQLLERRGLEIDEFINKVSKTPIITN